eukprot:CAMPEP_0170404896 /NCGR_PEP_ID=MMETSP0117_2-20130122/26884_1 /TAXON_ID=400756 /ORGANISM="Durinskia baltica, Strain CSIRO CS-38" /LENGTH=61 /DNA_ID=CAMNT_0010661959 /DNA_START=150 /DNA_END=335 /DNA_ORIENTATION=+
MVLPISSADFASLHGAPYPAQPRNSSGAECAMWAFILGGLACSMQRSGPPNPRDTGGVLPR